MNQVPLETRIRIIAALLDGNSQSAVSRLTGVQENTVSRWALVVGEACKRLHDTLVRDLRTTTIQVDEIWTYVGKKQGRLTGQEPVEFGDTYTFVAICPVTKLVISYVADKRTGETAESFMDDLSARIIGRPTILSDGFNGYPAAVDLAFGAQANYGQLVKSYAGRPQRLQSITKRVLMGTMDESAINTSFVERQNLTMRVGMRRFTRRTSGYSKSLRHLRAAIGLHFGFYNFVRIHETLRVTPAMEAGLTQYPWSLRELLERAMEAPANDGPPPQAPLIRGKPTFAVIQGGRK